MPLQKNFSSYREFQSLGTVAIVRIQNYQHFSKLLFKSYFEDKLFQKAKNIQLMNHIQFEVMLTNKTYIISGQV